MADQNDEYVYARELACRQATSNDDQVLHGRITQGDAEALGLLYERYGKQICNAALFIVGDYGAAEEITQDTFLRLWERAEQYCAERGSFKTWLLTIARRRAIDELRSRRGASQRRAVPLDEGVAYATATDEVALIHLYIDLKQALAELPAGQSEVLSLSLFADISRQEIAQHLNSPAATIYTRYRTGMQRLRAIL